MTSQDSTPTPGGTPGPEGPPRPEGTPKSWQQIYSDPVVFLATLIVSSVILLIGAAVLGVDKGVLSGMSKSEYARGLISYLFAIVTIGIAVALVLSALTAQIAFDEKFQKAKEVLALLLGVFGTIIGFYFASETNRGVGSEPLQLSSLDLTPQPAGSTGAVMLRAVVRGGAPPYRFGVGQGKAPTETSDVASDGGWIVKQVALRAPAAGESQAIYVLVEDANRKRVEQAGQLRPAAP
jgi:hypothetical protein